MTEVECTTEAPYTVMTSMTALEHRARSGTWQAWEALLKREGPVSCLGINLRRAKVEKTTACTDEITRQSGRQIQSKGTGGGDGKAAVNALAPSKRRCKRDPMGSEWNVLRFKVQFPSVCPSRTAGCAYERGWVCGRGRGCGWNVGRICPSRISSHSSRVLLS